MTRDEVINAMNDDLAREYSHWHFYINAAIVVKSLHREEFQEFFLKEAAGEMNHIKEFGCTILGMGGVPETDVADYPVGATDPLVLIQQAITLEKEVVKHYAERMAYFGSLAALPGPSSLPLEDAKYLEAFYEGQLLDSRATVDHLTQML